MCKYLLLIVEEGEKKIVNLEFNCIRVFLVICMYVVCMFVCMFVYVYMWGIWKWMLEVGGIVFIFYVLDSFLIEFRVCCFVILGGEFVLGI